MFDTTSHDFGTVARGAKVEHSFTITNPYKEDAHIVDVRSSCGCTTPRITVNDLKTYEKSALVATFNTPTFTGQRSATLTVVFDKPFYAEVQVHVSGYIRSDIVLNPGSVQLGAVDQGTPVEKHIQLSYAGRDDWQVMGVKSGSPYLEASVGKPERRSGQVTYDLAVKLKDDAPSGPIHEQLVLVTNDFRSPEFPVDVEGRVVSELTVIPSSLLLGVLHPGDKVTKRMVIKSKKPFKIVGVKCDDCFQIQPPETVKNLQQIPITFTAGEKLGNVTRKIRIETDLGSDVVCEFSAYARIISDSDAPAPSKPAPDKSAAK
jgi:Protein of unknown function (DUF1573)